MTHTCHAHDCTKPVAPKLFLCRDHWYALRKPLRDAISREYRPGQEVDKRPSARYLAVQRRAVAELVFKPHDEQAASASVPYLLSSEKFRAIAISLGEGDPLEGL